MKIRRTLIIFIICILFICSYFFYKYEKNIIIYVTEKISDFRGFYNKPEVSVLMPTYNRSDLLLKSVNSILKQKYHNFELVILDDGSSIKNWNLLFKFLIKDRRIRVYFNKQNKGRPYSRNKLFDLSKGKYLAIMDDDDTAYPNRLSEQVSYMDKNQDVDVCFSLATYNEDKNKTFFIGPSDYAELNLFFTTPFPHPSMMIKKEFIEAHNIRYNESYSVSEDYDFYYQLFMNKAKFHVLQKKLINVRIHHTNPDEYYQKRDDIFYKIRKKFQSLFFGDNEKLYNLTFCKKLNKMYELNKTLHILEQEPFKKALDYNCNR